ncbi:MAG: YdjY domain-containing protein [Phycisphaerae bacterium]|nr:YdjY domain-containing protein [Phycisphaerae bacterium]
MGRRLLILLGLGFLPALTTAAEPPAADPAAAPATQPAAKNPLPGITLDKQRRRVMLECSTLHSGVPLELVACMPNSREHEALMVVKARPQRIHLALLLAGFEPGHPASWDEKKEKPIMPTGDPLDLQVQWTDPKTEKQQTVPIEDWMAAMDPAKPVPRLEWVFTGSQVYENGQYMADMEGSVVSISNFPDAVIDLSGKHSRDNAALEFKGNDKIMPPAGTKCTLIIQPPASLRVELDRFGKVLVNGKAAAANKVADLLAAHRRCRDDARVELTVSPDAAKADVDKLVRQAEDAGFKDRIDRRVPSTQPGAFVFPANDPLAAFDLLTGEWKLQRVTIAQNISDQQRWLAQARDRRELLARQYAELAGYMNLAREQYRQAAAQLKK